jgi:hypothetical protein
VHDIGMMHPAAFPSGAVMVIMLGLSRFQS